MSKAAAYYTVLGHGSFATGNAEGGPPTGGLYLLDVVPNATPATPYMMNRASDPDSMKRRIS